MSLINLFLIAWTVFGLCVLVVNPVGNRPTVMGWIAFGPVVWVLFLAAAIASWTMYLGQKGWMWLNMSTLQYRVGFEQFLTQMSFWR